MKTSEGGRQSQLTAGTYIQKRGNPQLPQPRKSENPKNATRKPQ
jgi:hypothetical protein